MKTLVAALAVFTSVNAFGQAPPPARVWTGNFGAGLAMTNGNTDTKNVNLSLGIVRDPKKKSVIRVNGLYLRGDKNGALTVDRATLTVRDEFSLNPKLFLFGQGDYLMDTFKQIQYLISPTGGLGYKLISSDTTQLSIDSGVGGIWEKDAGRRTNSGGALNAGERFSWKASKTATVTQSIGSVWKMKNWGDSLHNFGVGLSASVTSHSELKLAKKPRVSATAIQTVGATGYDGFLIA